MIPVESSYLAAVDYDDHTAKLSVQFKAGGPMYVYQGVTRGDFESLMRAESIGKHFASRIKGSYRFEVFK
jgi:hypothetical protein